MTRPEKSLEAPELPVLKMLLDRGVLTNDLGVRCPINLVYRRFGTEAARCRLKQLEGQGLVRFTGRGRNRRVGLTPAGVRYARGRTTRAAK